MENVNKCAQCFSDNTNNYNGPFCSERCGNMFDGYAPISLINSVYNNYKNRNSEKIELLKDTDAQILECKECCKEIDYDFVDERVEYFCSSDCVDSFVDSSRYTDTSIVFGNFVFNVNGKGK